MLAFHSILRVLSSLPTLRFGILPALAGAPSLCEYLRFGTGEAMAEMTRDDKCCALRLRVLLYTFRLLHARIRRSTWDEKDDPHMLLQRGLSTAVIMG